MRIILTCAVAAIGLVACASSHPKPATDPFAATSTTTTTTSAQEPVPSGYSGTTNYGINNSPDGTPYKGNVDPGNKASNREPRKEQKNVVDSSNAE
jgi:hypothetical protein